VEAALRKFEKPFRVAVMGCVVNGPGEAADADFAICAAKDKAYFYRNGQRIATVPEAQIIPRLLEALASWLYRLSQVPQQCGRRLLRRCASRHDTNGHACHCERSEAIYGRTISETAS
jgi:hypothetical protein